MFWVCLSTKSNRSLLSQAWAKHLLVKIRINMHHITFRWKRMLKKRARAERNRAANSIAVIPLPDDVPVVAVVGAAAGLVIALSGLLVFLCCRRRRQLAAAEATRDGKNVEGTVA